MRIAIPTKHDGGLTDIVSEVFSRANTFTLIDIEEKVIQSVEVLSNPAIHYQHGAGPIVAKMLTDKCVNIVISTQFGPGVSVLCEHFKIQLNKTTPDIQVKTAIEQFLESTNNL
jgi:predicted Fe-Mo cluster-binding NifX family protein